VTGATMSPNREGPPARWWPLFLGILRTHMSAQIGGLLSGRSGRDVLCSFQFAPEQKSDWRVYAPLDPVAA
jgi:hypothetical protein